MALITSQATSFIVIKAVVFLWNIHTAGVFAVVNIVLEKDGDEWTG